MFLGNDDVQVHITTQKTNTDNTVIKSRKIDSVKECLDLTNFSAGALDDREFKSTKLRRFSSMAQCLYTFPIVLVSVVPSQDTQVDRHSMLIGYRRWNQKPHYF
jgi:hypothetical protein